MLGAYWISCTHIIGAFSESQNRSADHMSWYQLVVPGHNARWPTLCRAILILMKPQDEHSQPRFPNPPSRLADRKDVAGIEATKIRAFDYHIRREWSDCGPLLVAYV